MKRVISLDILKGLIIVIMSLDHFRVFFHSNAFLFNPTDPENTDTITFLMRWITHYCAPVFSFLAGTSAFIVGNKTNKKYLSNFLFTRGLWLIFVEVAIMNFGWRFDVQYTYVVLQVIWVLGICMVALSQIIRLTNKQILVFSLVVIFGHNLLDRFEISNHFLWAVFHQLEIFEFKNFSNIVVAYPFLPWIGVMSLGYFFGQYYVKGFDSKTRIKLLMNTGLYSIIGFFIVRVFNSYGNAKLWQYFDDHTSTLYAFFDPNKYPPSLSYVLMTLGPMFLLLGILEITKKNKLSEFFIVFGKVPFFFYILHVYFIHALALAYAELTGFGFESMLLKAPIWMTSHLKGFGLSTPILLICWVVFVLLMYPLCKVFGNYKLKNKHKKWLSYL